MVIEIICSALVLTGALFTLLAALGILRFPDVYSRMHASTKAGSLGAGLIFISIGVQSGELSVILRAVAGFFFIVLTGPLAAHLLSRAAYRAGVPMGQGTTVDHLEGAYEGPGDTLGPYDFSKETRSSSAP
ncbi:MAG: monovalent cation/H(+) antiporter subunit G [Alphaproteobacteria bacterium]